MARCILKLETAYFRVDLSDHLSFYELDLQFYINWRSQAISLPHGKSDKPTLNIDLIIFLKGGQHHMLWESRQRSILNRQNPFCFLVRRSLPFHEPVGQRRLWCCWSRCGRHYAHVQPYRFIEVKIGLFQEIENLVYRKWEIIYSNHRLFLALLMSVMSFSNTERSTFKIGTYTMFECLLLC